MKCLLSSMVLASAALTACTTAALGLNDGNTIKAGSKQAVQAVQVINIPSFKIEVSAFKVSCDIAGTDGAMVRTECIQFRQPFQKHFNTLTTDIQGFDYEPGYRYLLDVRQEAVTNPQTGESKPVWVLNEIINKTSVK
ncbi:DUF4377 domain-containing protein [Psychrobacter lutiphocae]|uniref:DUF4377 domain-containing protein n=1 Tax=Psychrobacter lutiphocae TaxID=540500 RepID=UPI0003806F0A|nr:DUF4377 domain-containing protein [Psychrobacter lutiphocae]